MATEEGNTMTPEEVKKWEEYMKTDEGKKFMEEMAKIIGIEKDQIEKFDSRELYEKILANPRLKNFQRRREIASGIEGGIEALRLLSNAATARRQIDESRRLENELQDPAAPPTTPKSTELQDATETARRATVSPIKEIDPLLQRNMDMLRQDFASGDTISGGQAGIAGAMRQNSIENARKANQALIPAIENIRRQQQSEYNRLIQAGIGEDDMRFQQAMQKYRIAENRYLTEAQAIGQLGATGRENLFNQQQGLYDLMGSAAQPMMNFDWRNNPPEQTQSQAQVFGVNNPMNIQNKQYGMRKQYSALEALDPKYGEKGRQYDQNLQDHLAFGAGGLNPKYRR